MANGIEPKPVEHVRPPRVPSYQEQSRMRNFHAAAIGKEPNSTKPPCSLYQSFDHWVWFCKEFMTEVWMTAGRSLKKKSCVFIA